MPDATARGAPWRTRRCGSGKSSDNPTRRRALHLSPGSSPGKDAEATRAGRSAWAFCLIAAALAGCSEPPETGGDGAAAAAIVTASTLGEQEIRATADYLAMAPYATADRERGARLAQLCRACHTTGAGEPAMLGPNLHGVFGRRAGTRENFDYSPALRNADFAWTPRALDAWLAEPARFLPGNRMSFTGVNEAGDRASLIAYLLEATSAEDAGQ